MWTHTLSRLHRFNDGSHGRLHQQRQHMFLHLETHVPQRFSSMIGSKRSAAARSFNLSWRWVASIHRMQIGVLHKRGDD